MPANPLNLILLVSDQHNAKVLGHAGHPTVKTPHLDRMAAEGARFATAITASPICTPSRVSFLSGQYCHNHGYYGNKGPNPGSLPSLFDHFRRFGYTTAAVGKIHCPEYWIENACDMFHETGKSSVGGRSAAYTAFLKERGKLELEDHSGLPEFGERGRQTMDSRPSPLAFEESQEGWIADTSINIMRHCQEQGRSFLLHASLPRPHQCTSPCQEFWDLYNEDALVLPPNADYDMVAAIKAPHAIETAKSWRTRDWPLLEPRTFEAARKRKLHGYLGAVSQVDAAVGRILDYLRESGLAERTLVVYISDHGDYACEHGLMEKAPGICSDAITRVPMIWWGPSYVKHGHVSRELVHTIDIAPTFCAEAGVEPMETADGLVLSELLRGNHRDAWVNRPGLSELIWSKSLRCGRHRLVLYTRAMFPDTYPQGFGELYDLEADPWEMRNLYFEASHQGIVNAMRAELLDLLSTTTRPRTVMGNWTPATQTQGSARHISALDGKVPSSWLYNTPSKQYF